MKKLSVLIVLLYVTISISAYAQENTAKRVKVDTLIQSEYTLEDVNVIAKKEQRNIFQLPMRSMQLKTAAIEQQQIRSLRSLSAVVPNLFMPDYGSKLTAPIYIRGIGSRINSPSVGLYVDGVPYFEKSAFDFELFDIAAIDILSGSQAALYGRNTMGGIIHVHTRLPQNKRKTSVKLGLANYENYSIGLQHHQPLGKKVQMSLGGLWKQGHYQIKNIYDNKYVDDQKNGVGRLKIAYKPNKRLRFVWNTQYDNSSQKGYPYALYNDKENAIQKVNYNNESYYDRKMLSNSLVTSYAFKSFVLESVTAHQYIDDDQVVDQDFTHRDMFWGEQTQNINILSQEVYLKSKPKKDAKYEWITSVFAFYQKVDRNVDVYFKKDAVIVMPSIPAQMYYQENFNNHNLAWAVSHQSTFNDVLTKGLSVNLGLRFDREYSDLDFVKDTYLTESKQKIKALNFDSKLNFSQWIPKAGLNYHLSPDANTYVSVSKGYKVGGFNTSFAKNEDRTYEPEYSWNYEWGVKALLWEKKLRTSLSLFYIDWRNQQVYQPIVNEAGEVRPGNLLQNAAKSRSKGLEFSATAFIKHNWQVNARFGYTDAEYVDYSKGKKTFDNNKLPYVPKYTFYTDVRYTMDIHQPYLKSISYILSYSGIGKHYWTEDNVAYQNYYGLLNANVVFANKNWNVTLWAKNLLDTDYRAFYFQAIGLSYAQQGRPMAFGIKIGLDI